MVQVVQPVLLIEEPLILDGDSIVHVLHWEADAVGKFLECVLDVDYPSSSVSLWIESHIVSLACSFPHICQYALFFDF